MAFSDVIIHIQPTLEQHLRSREMASEKPKKPTLVAVPDVHSAKTEKEAEMCPKCFGSGLEVVPGKGRVRASAGERTLSQNCSDVRNSRSDTSNVTSITIGHKTRPRTAPLDWRRSSA